MQKKSRPIIGFAAIGDFRSIIGQEIINGITKACSDLEINLINFTGIIYNSLAEDIEYKIHYKKVLKFLNGYNIDGLITWASTFYTFMTNEEIYQYHNLLKPLPTVCIGMPVPGIPSIYLDDRAGIKKIMTHLIKVHNKKKIAFVGIDNKKHFSYIERYNAYLDTLKEFNLPFDKELYFNLEEIGNKEEIKKVVNLIVKEKKLFEKNEIDSIVTVSDIVTCDLIEEFSKNEIFTPGHLAIVGFNNQLESIRSTPPITTIEPHFYELGYKAVKSLNMLLKGERVNDKDVTPCDLIIRESCGCIEENITKINLTDSKTEKEGIFELLTKDQSELLIKKLTKIVKSFNEKLTEATAKEMLDSLIYDIQKENSYKFINFIKSHFFDYENVTENKLVIWQNIISNIRSQIFSYLNSDYTKLLKIENIFHQTRVMIDIAYSYLSYSKKGDQYQLNTLIKMSTDLRLTKNIKEIYSLLKLYFKEFGIENFFLYLFELPKDDISFAKSICSNRLSPDNTMDEKEIIPTGRIPIKKIFPSAKQSSFVFQLLFFKDKYLGFILMELGPINLPLFDSIRKILSPSIYLTFDIEQSNFSNDFDEIKKKFTNGRIQEGRKRLTASKIVEYLSNHIDVMTDIDVIAKDLNISKPSLMKKTKQITGYSVQKLHEMLKIEKAKKLFETNRDITISEVSYYLGYKDQLYFSRVFRKNTGLSPRKWIDTYIKSEK